MDSRNILEIDDKNEEVKGTGMGMYVQGEENKHFRPDTSSFLKGIITECLEGRQYYEDSSPPVIKGKR